MEQRKLKIPTPFGCETSETSSHSKTRPIFEGPCLYLNMGYSSLATKTCIYTMCVYCSKKAFLDTHFSPSLPTYPTKSSGTLKKRLYLGALSISFPAPSQWTNGSTPETACNWNPFNHPFPKTNFSSFGLFFWL